MSCLPFPNQQLVSIADAPMGDVTGAIAEAWGQSIRETPVRARILIVDDIDLHLQVAGTILREDGYEVFTAERASDALAILDRDEVDLVVLDLGMPDMNGVQCCREIRANPKTRMTPVLMVTGTEVSEEECLSGGADEFMAKPYSPEALRSRIRAMLRHRSAIERLEEAESILFALAVAVEQRDPYTAGHCERLAMYSVALGMRLQLRPKELLALHRGGYLHDIGKVGMPDSILFKPGRLTEDEWTVMRTHTVRGEEICRPLRCLKDVLPIIRSHHERWDGSGYPDGLKKTRIPMLARILQVADVFDALTTRRPYKDALSTKEALRVMEHEMESGWYEPGLMQQFFELNHELLRKAATENAATIPDLESMKQSLINLNFAVG